MARGRSQQDVHGESASPPAVAPRVHMGGSGEQTPIEDLPYGADDPEHRLAVALTEARRACGRRGTGTPTNHSTNSTPGNTTCSGASPFAFPPDAAWASWRRCCGLTPRLLPGRSIAWWGPDWPSSAQATEDRRVLVVQATVAGRRLVNNMSRQATHRWRAMLHSALSSTEIALLAEWLERMVTAVDTAVSADE